MQIESTYPLDEVRLAYTVLAKRHSRGKVALIPKCPERMLARILGTPGTSARSVIVVRDQPSCPRRATVVTEVP